MDRRAVNGAGTSDAVRQMAGGLGRLFADHAALARLELTEALKKSGVDLGMLAGAAVFLLVGYGFLCAGVAILLTRWLGLAGGLFAVGGAHAAAAAALAAVGARRLRQRAWLEETSAEWNRTVAELTEPARRQELPDGG